MRVLFNVDVTFEHTSFGKKIMAIYMGSIDISKLEHGMQPLQYEFFPTKIIFPPQTASIMIRSHALLQASYLPRELHVCMLHARAWHSTW